MVVFWIAGALPITSFRIFPVAHLADNQSVHYHRFFDRPVLDSPLGINSPFLENKRIIYTRRKPIIIKQQEVDAKRRNFWH